MADLASKPVQILARGGGAAAGAELKSPAMERADGLAFLDPPMSERTVGVRAAAEEGVVATAVEKQGDPETIDLDRVPASFSNLFRATDFNKPGQFSLLRQDRVKIE